jgi:hypothetical protein
MLSMELVRVTGFGVSNVEASGSISRELVVVLNCYARN